MLVWLLMLTLLPADTSRTMQLAVGPAESLRVTIAGSGDPVVLIPGIIGSAFGYRNLLPLLSEAGYQAVVIEPLGVGGSSRPERADYSLSAQTRRIAMALDSLALRRTIVVAHSVGGSIAFRLAIQRPELVRAILSLEGGPVEKATTPGFRRAIRFAPWIKLFGGLRPIRRKIKELFLASSADTTWVNDAVVTGYTAAAAADLDATLKGYLGMALSREPEKLEPRLTEVRCLVRLMVGAKPHSGGVSPADIELLGRRLPWFELDTVPGVGHFPHEEQPVAVMRAVERLSALTASRHPVSAAESDDVGA